MDLCFEVEVELMLCCVEVIVDEEVSKVDNNDRQIRVRVSCWKGDVIWLMCRRSP